MASRIEAARDSIIAEFQNISVANGYRTTPAQVIGTIRPLDKITVFPEIGIELGDEILEAKDDNWELFDSLVDVAVVGAFTSATDVTDTSSTLFLESEKLAHDIRRVVAHLMKEWQTRGINNFWNITPTKQIEIFRITGLGEKRNKGVVGSSFRIRVRAMNEQFEDPNVTEVGELALEQGGELLQESTYNILTEQKV